MKKRPWLFLLWAGVFGTCCADTRSNPTIQPLSPEYQQFLIEKHLWYPACPVALARLREVTVPY